MLKANRTHLVLLLIFTFSFVYRLVLMLLDSFPPGADIGLHNSVIYSITGSGNVNFFYNFYHIGGGISLTFPGYHIFTASVIMMTGLPEWIAHAAVVSMFSSLIVLAGFLITKRVWSESAAFIVAFLVAISRFDVEMLLWGGYPNVVTLLLIPVCFYMYLQKDRFSAMPFLASTSIIAGSVFLTHSLSAAIFVAITAITVLSALVNPKMFGTTRRTCLYWLLPIVVGAVLFSPFIVQAAPAYLNNNSSLSGDSASSAAIKLATLATRPLPLEFVLPLFGAFAGLLVFSKRQFGRFVSLPTFLFAIWLVLPLTLTLSYLVGFPIDYNRFLYFLILPLLVFTAVFIEYGSKFFANVIVNYRTLTSQTQKTKKTTNQKLARFSAALTSKNLYAGFIMFFLLFSFLALPIFMGPMYNGGQVIQQFYQTMDNKGWDALQWAKTNTPKDSVFVTDALYGWWLSGFAQRRTYSAVEPQYLSISDEYNKTLFARNLLDTDYIIDNNSTLVPQVRDDGGYISRHNPEILVKQNWTYYPSSFFNFNSNGASVRYHIGNDPAQKVTLDQLALKDTRLESTSDHATITVTRSNDDFNYSISTTVTAGVRFVNVTSTLTSRHSEVHFDWVDVVVEAKAVLIRYVSDRTVGFVDVGTKAFGQLIFNTIPYSTFPGASTILLTYSLEGKNNGQIGILATAFSASNNELFYSSQQAIDTFFSPIMTQNLDSALEPMPENVHLDTFDYRSELQAWNVSFIVCTATVTGIEPKFFKDPLFNLVFINSEVSIFKVNGNPTQEG